MQYRGTDVCAGHFNNLNMTPGNSAPERPERTGTGTYCKYFKLLLGLLSLRQEKARSGMADHCPLQNTRKQKTRPCKRRAAVVPDVRKDAIGHLPTWKRRDASTARKVTSHMSSV